MRIGSWLVATSLLLHGCSSLVILEPRPYRPEVHGEPSCWGNYAPPAVDSFIALSGLALGALGTAVAIDFSGPPGGVEPGPADAAQKVGITVAAAGYFIAASYGGFSVYGYREAKRCRNAHEDYQLHIQRTHEEEPPGAVD